MAARRHLHLATDGSVTQAPAARSGQSADRGSRARIWRYVSLLTVLAVWILMTKDGLGLVAPIKFPSPSMVVKAVLSMDLAFVATSIGVTFLRMTVGLASGVILGVGLGLAMTYSPVVENLLDPVVESMRPVPAIAAIPFFILWFGIAEIGKFLLVLMGVSMIMLVATVEAVRNVAPIFVAAAQTLGASKGRIYRTIIIPAVVPDLIGALRVSAAMAFTLVAAAEFMGAQTGIGYLILNARRTLQTDVLYLGIVLFGVLSGIVDGMIRRIARVATSWADRLE